MPLLVDTFSLTPDFLDCAKCEIVCRCEVWDFNAYIREEGLVAIHEMKVAAHQQLLDGKAAGGCSFKTIKAILIVGFSSRRHLYAMGYYAKPDAVGLTETGHVFGHVQSQALVLYMRHSEGAMPSMIQAPGVFSRTSDGFADVLVIKALGRRADLDDGADISLPPAAEQRAQAVFETAGIIFILLIAIAGAWVLIRRRI